MIRLLAKRHRKHKISFAIKNCDNILCVKKVHVIFILNLFLLNSEKPKRFVSLNDFLNILSYQILKFQTSFSIFFCKFFLGVILFS